jgi:hypothetical protein
LRWCWCSSSRSCRRRSSGRRRARRWRRSRCGCGRRCHGSSRCRRRRRTWNASRGLDEYTDRPATLKEAYRCVRRVWCLVGIEPEVIQCAETNGIGVLISCKRFAIPSDGDVARLVVIAPRRAAIALIIECAVVCPARLLGRRVEPDVTDIHSRSYRHVEGLNGSIEVLIIERVLIMPHAATQVGDFVTHEPDTIMSRVGLDLIYCCTRPSHDRWLHTHRRAHLRKGEIWGAAAHAKLTVSGVVIHVALVRMTLAPGVFTRGNILRFGKICRPLIERLVQVVDLHTDSMRYTVVIVALMIVCSRWEIPREWIDPGA